MHSSTNIKELTRKADMINSVRYLLLMPCVPLIQICSFFSLG